MTIPRRAPPADSAGSIPAATSVMTLPASVAASGASVAADIAMRVPSESPPAENEPREGTEASDAVTMHMQP